MVKIYHRQMAQTVEGEFKIIGPNEHVKGSIIHVRIPSEVQDERIRTVIEKAEEHIKKVEELFPQNPVVEFPTRPKIKEVDVEKDLNELKRKFSRHT